MKITRELIDNGMKIVHAQYDDEDIEEIKKRHQEKLEKQKNEQIARANDK